MEYLLASDDPELYVDMRKNNGRPKNKQFDPFWEELGRYLEEKSAVHERREESILFLPFAISVADLISIIKERLPVDAQIPSTSWVRYQFWPSNPYITTSMKYTGRFNVKYAVQRRLLRSQHEDAQYAGWMFHLSKEFAVKYRTHVEYICEDDKSIVPVGEPEKPVSALLRHHNRSLTTKDNTTIVALDHDYHVCGLVPSVTFKVNIPEDPRDSFYQGNVYIHVKDKIFEPSSAMRHAAETVLVLREQSEDLITLEAPILIKYSDGGPDHRTTFATVQVASVAMFVALDLDMLIALRTAPNQSYINPCERMMSTLNMGLQNTALQRDKMIPGYEMRMKSLGSIKAVR
jgi:hypothetical protein